MVCGEAGNRVVGREEESSEFGQERLPVWVMGEKKRLTVMMRRLHRLRRRARPDPNGPLAESV